MSTMEPFLRHTGLVAPLMRINIDTDQITPGPFLSRAYKLGWASALFGNWRFLADGALDESFILNREPWTRATILLAGRNFGCGSSRESAPKALRAFGFRVVIAPSFGGIFFGNCFRNGLLPVELTEAEVETLADLLSKDPEFQVTVDLESNQVHGPDGRIFTFESPEYFRDMLLNGLDEIGQTLSKGDAIDAFWTDDAGRRPWVQHPGP